MSSNKSQDESGKLSGRVAIITGSSSGMGRAIALALAEEGASIVCADLQPEASPKGYEVDKHIPTHDLISLNGGRAVFQKCDLGKTEEIVRLVQLAVETYGKLDILVNNAGLWVPLRPFVEETDEIWQSMLNINTRGPATAMREAIRQFLRQPVTDAGSRGRIVNISSSAGITAIAGETAYAASKAALSMLTRNAALDHAKDSININAVCPGVVRTALSSTNFNDDSIITEMRKSTPWPRLGEPRDIARVVLFLCSDDAQWMTGQNIAIDGGFTVGIPL